MWDEYVSVEGARLDYGVVVSGSLEDMTLAIDEQATATLRAELIEKAEATAHDRAWLSNRG